MDCRFFPLLPACTFAVVPRRAPELDELELEAEELAEAPKDKDKDKDKDLLLLLLLEAT